VPIVKTGYFHNTPQNFCCIETNFAVFLSYNVSFCFRRLLMISFLAPDEKIFATAKATLIESHPDIRIEQGLLSAGVEKAGELIAAGTEIIITRGGTARVIKEAFPCDYRRRTADHRL
jgi:hypothetical protein